MVRRVDWTRATGVDQLYNLVVTTQPAALHPRLQQTSTCLALVLLIAFFALGKEAAASRSHLSIAAFCFFVRANATGIMIEDDQESGAKDSHILHAVLEHPARFPDKGLRLDDNTPGPH